MKYIRFKLIAILVFGLGLRPLFAQSSIVVCGGNASGIGGSFGFSVSQICYKTDNGSNGSAAYGIQQAYEIQVVAGLEDAMGINLAVLAYPNPTNDYLKLEVKEYNLLNLSYWLYDMKGALIQNNEIISNQTSIVMTNLVSGTYYLKIIQKKNIIKTFKIIKK